MEKKKLFLIEGANADPLLSMMCVELYNIKYYSLVTKIEGKSNDEIKKSLDKERNKNKEIIVAYSGEEDNLSLLENYLNCVCIDLPRLKAKIIKEVGGFENRVQKREVNQLFKIEILELLGWKNLLC